MMLTRASIEVNDDVVTLTLTPPDGKPPTVDPSLLDALESWFFELADAPGEVTLSVGDSGGELRPVTCSPRLLILRSPVPKWFCAGANISVLQTITPESIGPWVRRGNEVFQLLADLAIPTLARVEGYALGGGVEIALACDVIFAGENAVLGQTEATLGFVPGWGACGRLPQRVGAATAKRLFYTGEMVSATEALRIGLVDAVFPAAELDSAVNGFVAKVKANSPVAIAAFKAIVNAAPADWQGVMEAEVNASVDCVKSADTQFRLAAFLNRRSRQSPR